MEPRTIIRARPNRTPIDDAIVLLLHNYISDILVCALVHLLMGRFLFPRGDISPPQKKGIFWSIFGLRGNLPSDMYLRWRCVSESAPHFGWGGFLLFPCRFCSTEEKWTTPNTMRYRLTSSNCILLCLHLPMICPIPL